MTQGFKNIIFVGTSHISKESILEVEKTILDEKPAIIAIELDNARLHALLAKKQRKSSLSDINTVGVKGYLFGRLGAWIENRLSKVTGSSPGSEMKKAISLAKETNTPLALIDQDIRITLRRISKTLTFKEKTKFVKDIIKSLFIKGSRGFDITKVPEDEIVSKLSRQLKKEYPNLFQVLITERNVYMSKALYKLSQDNLNKKIVAVLGAGHINGIIDLLKKEKWSAKKKTGRKQNQL